MTPIESLIDISRYYGTQTQYVIAGGGNTSYKDNEKLWVKASGFSLGTITEAGFAVLDRNTMTNLTPERRPSIETPIHNALAARFVVHLHPTYLNGLLCSQQARSMTEEIFGDTVLFMPYIAPGVPLFEEMARLVAEYKARHGYEPAIIFLQNHGVIVGADTTQEIQEYYASLDALLMTYIKEALPPDQDLDVPSAVTACVPAVRSLVSQDGLPKAIKVVNSPLIQYFAQSAQTFEEVAHPFIPDHIAYCRSRYLYVDQVTEEALATAAAEAQKIIMVKGLGLIAIGQNPGDCDTVALTYTDVLRVAWLSRSFGGPAPMTESQTAFIDNWDAEKYRRQIRYAAASGRMNGKTVIVTGAAQGFGLGIAQCLMDQGANMVVADLNAEAGQQVVDALNAPVRNNKALFVKTNVADTDSLQRLMEQTVCRFGGVDLFVNNAGVLRAGSLDQMTAQTFEFVTKINYTAYFLCVKAVQSIMKLQNKYAPDTYADIIQVNSKSGLRGSKANFAYAGGKFGGLGLTQSFALELAPFRIKVNSVCPGNYYEGPLWSDPENGLFLQYLRAGKVPGAKTVEDVRDYYMAQVPMRKGCNPLDVTRAILYLVEQTCETGQAVPITGGQVMLN